MSDIDLQDAINSALDLIHAVRLISEGLGRSAEASSICAVSDIAWDKMAEVRDALAVRKEEAAA